LLRSLIRRNPCLMFNWYPPLLGAGIRVTRIQPDWKELDVEMRLRWWNANYVGTHYGGSLYSLADPFLMVMFIEILGRDYVVWDKAASIRFRRPGRGTVYAKFRIGEEQVAEIRAGLENQNKIEREFVVGVKDQDGELIAEVKKLLHFRKRENSSPATQHSQARASR
jgi:acyl-coenzyme A thioesterase PaaI-like protein